MSTISANKREDFKNSAVTKLRRDGKVPAVVYGKDKSNQHIYLDSIHFMKTMREAGRNSILQLRVENDQPESVMLHDIQMNPLTGDVVHADFFIVNMASKVDVEVNVHLVGEAKGVLEGGLLQQPLYKINVRCLPTDIPEKIDIDISQNEIGDAIVVGDIQTNGKFEITDDHDTVIASILPPKVENDVDSGEVQANDDERAAENSKAEEE